MEVERSLARARDRPLHLVLGPAYLHLEHERLPVDFGWNVGEQSRGSPAHEGEDGDYRDRSAECLEEAGARAARNPAGHDEPDDEAGDESEEGYPDDEVPRFALATGNAVPVDARGGDEARRQQADDAGEEGADDGEGPGQRFGGGQWFGLLV